MSSNTEHADALSPNSGVQNVFDVVKYCGWSHVVYARMLANFVFSAVFESLRRATSKREQYYSKFRFFLYKYMKQTLFDCFSYYRKIVTNSLSTTKKKPPETISKKFFFSFSFTCHKDTPTLRRDQGQCPQQTPTQAPTPALWSWNDANKKKTGVSFLFFFFLKTIDNNVHKSRRRDRSFWSRLACRTTRLPNARASLRNWTARSCWNFQLGLMCPSGKIEDYWLQETQTKKKKRRFSCEQITHTITIFRRKRLTPEGQVRFIAVSK